MASPINSGFDLDSEVIAIPTNRWARCCYTLQVDSGTVELAGTTQEFNRPDRVTGVAPTPIYHILDDAQGNALGAAGVGIHVIVGYALTGVQITADAAASGRFMQQGETG